MTSSPNAQDTVLSAFTVAATWATVYLFFGEALRCSSTELSERIFAPLIARRAAELRRVGQTTGSDATSLGTATIDAREHRVLPFAEPPSLLPFTWLPAALRGSDAQLLRVRARLERSPIPPNQSAAHAAASQERGLDAALDVRFARDGLLAFLLCLPFDLSAVLYANAAGSLSNAGADAFTVGRVAPGSRLLWLHALSMALKTGVVLAFLSRTSRWVAAAQAAAAGARLDTPAARAVLITDLPPPRDDCDGALFQKPPAAAKHAPPSTAALHGDDGAAAAVGAAANTLRSVWGDAFVALRPIFDPSTCDALSARRTQLVDALHAALDAAAEEAAGEEGCLDAEGGPPSMGLGGAGSGDGDSGDDDAAPLSGHGVLASSPWADTVQSLTEELTSVCARIDAARAAAMRPVHGRARDTGADAAESGAAAARPPISQPSPEAPHITAAPPGRDLPLRPACVAEFATARDALVAAQVALFPPPVGWCARPAPQPADCEWSHIGRVPSERKPFVDAAATASLYALVLFYSAFCVVLRLVTHPPRGHKPRRSLALMRTSPQSHSDSLLIRFPATQWFR